MSKLSKRFEFNYPVFQTSVVNGYPTKFHLGNIRVEGVGYQDTSAQLYAKYPDDSERYDLDIDGIYWKGMNIIDLVSLESDDLMDRLHEKALRYLIDLFSPENLQDQIAAEQVDAAMQECA